MRLLTVETVGFIGRAIGAEQAPDYTFGPYVLQTLLLLLGPTCYAASIYMILGRYILQLKGEQFSLIRPSWLTKIFLLGDVISIALQGIAQPFIWQRPLVVIYVASALILIRSLFRMIEYIEGHDGELQSKEVYVLVLDAVPMTIASVSLNIFHPSKYMKSARKSLDDSDSEVGLSDPQGHSLGTMKRQRNSEGLECLPNA
uniref:Protein RTA1 n=1 Tax=Fusarium oxysporum (strain Fo5176) TaxID=660025 RepID=A0A0D2YEL1_FUSOF